MVAWFLRQPPFRYASSSASLAYFDSYRQAQGTANLIQGQRDFFGAHGFEIEGRGTDQHGNWPSTIDQ